MEYIHQTGAAQLGCMDVEVWSSGAQEPHCCHVPSQPRLGYSEEQGGDLFSFFLAYEVG